MKNNLTALVCVAVAASGAVLSWFLYKHVHKEKKGDVQQTNEACQSELTDFKIPEDNVAQKTTEGQISEDDTAQQPTEGESLASETDSSSAGSYKSSSPTPCYHSLSTVDSQDQLPQSFDFANPQAEWHCSSDFEEYIDTNICADVEINHVTSASDSDSSSCYSYVSGSPTPCYHSVSVTSGVSYDEESIGSRSSPPISYSDGPCYMTYSPHSENNKQHEEFGFGQFPSAVFDEMMDDTSDDSGSDVSRYSSEGDIQCVFHSNIDTGDCANRLTTDGDESSYFTTSNKTSDVHEDYGNQQDAASLMPRQVLAAIQNMPFTKDSYIYIMSPVETFLKDEEELSVPTNALCTVFVFSTNRPVMVLTFVSTDPEKATQYNSRLARAVTTAIRLQHPGKFHLVQGVIDQKTSFVPTRQDRCVRDLEREVKKIANPGSLKMDEELQKTFVQTFQKTIAIKRLIPSVLVISSFVKTEAYQVVRDKLRQGNVLILTGGPGDGKTTIGHRLCYDYHQQGYNTVYYSKEEDINWNVLKASKLTLVVCDNIKGTDFRSRLYGLSSKVLIIVLILELNNMDMFKDMDFVSANVSKIKKEDVPGIKQNYLKMLQMSSIRISETDLKKIERKLPIYVGFPKSVKLYRKYKHLNPVFYFTYPIHYFKQHIEANMTESGLRELVYIILCGGFCKYNADEKSFLHDSGVFEIMKQLFPDFVKVRHYGRHLIGDFLDDANYNTSTKVIHHALYDACLLAVDRRYPGVIWKHCKVVTERDEKQSHISLPKLTVFISRHSVYMFLTQIAEDLKQGKFRYSLSHPVLMTQENIEKLCVLIDKQLDAIVHTEERSRCFLYWAAHSGNQYLLKTVLAMKALAQSDVNRAQMDCIQLNQIKTFNFLREMLRSTNQHNLCLQGEIADSGGKSLLMAAVERSRVTFVKSIVEDAKTLLMENCEENTALHLACLKGDMEVIRYLLSKMETAKDMPRQASRTPIMIAALMGHYQVYGYLANVEKCQLTGCDANGDTILHLACIGGNLDIVKHLICSVAIDKDTKGQHGKTPLMLAADYKHMLLFEWLLEQNCHFPTEWEGFKLLFEDTSLLHIAANTGHLQLAEILLSQVNIDINIGNSSGRTPAMLAAAAGRRAVFFSLQDKGCDLSLKDNAKAGILHFACQGRNREIINFVIEKYAIDVNNEDKFGRTPLSYAVLEGDKETFDIMLNKDGNMFAIDRDKNTLLHLACMGGNLDIVSHLLYLPWFDINAKNRQCRTPLLLAAYNGHTQICDFMLSKGADLSVQDMDGNDTLLVAVTKGNKLLADLILKKDELNCCIKDRSGKTAQMKAAEMGHSELMDMLIRQSGTVLTDIDHNDNNILHIACCNGSIDTVKCLLSRVDINSRGIDSKTPVMLAAQRGYTDVFYLLESGNCDLTLTDEQEKNILHAACVGGSEDIVQNIISKNMVNIDSGDRQGKTPVMLAAENGHTAIFDLLVNEDCDLTVTDTFGENILHFACSAGNVDIINRIMFQDTVHIDSSNIFGKTPVMFAAEKGHGKVFDLLISRGCDLSVMTKDRMNILHAACLGGGMAIVKHILSENPVLLNSRTSGGKTPVMLTVQEAHTDVFNYLRKEGCDLTTDDRDGGTILHAACVGGSIDIIQTILSCNRHLLNSKDNSGQLPVMLAAEQGNAQIFNLLTCAGSDLSAAADLNGYTILHAACTGGSVEIVEYVLSQNIVDINCTDKMGTTPLQIAEENGYHHIVYLLKAKLQKQHVC